VEGAESKEGMREDAPRIEGFLGRGSPVTVSARTLVEHRTGEHRIASALLRTR
jgi:hypothetical protein